MTNLRPAIWLTAFLYLSNLSFGFSQQTWQHHYADGNAHSVAARGNDILVCTNGERGFVRFDTLGNPTFFDAVNSGLPFNFVTQVAIDDTGDWWVGYRGGIARYDGDNWAIWDTAQLGLSFYTSNLTVLEPSSEDGRTGAGTSSLGAAIYENGNWTILTTANSGLPSNNVRDIAFGPDGKIYFATGSGLAVLDGSNWTVFNSTNTGISSFNDCKSVALTSSGAIWVTIGANRFAKWENGTWTGFLPADIGMTAAGLSGTVITDEQDRVWISFSKYISVLDGTQWTHYPEAAIGCTLPALATGLKMAFDGAGQLWSTACGLTRFDGQIWDKPSIGNSLLPRDVYVMTQDTAGNMWFAGRNGGDFQMIAKKEGDNWQTLNPMELGLNDTITEIWTAHGDASGNVWFAMISGEILRFDGTDWSVFDTVAATYDDIVDAWFVASAPDGAVWFSFVNNLAPYGVLARYRDGEWTFYRAPDIPLPTDRIITSVAFGSDNTTWFRYFDGLLKFDGANWEAVALPNPSAPDPWSVRKIAAAPDGALWVATDAGLDRFDGATWTTISTSNSDIPSDLTTQVAFDRAGGMYVAYSPGGMGANCAVFRGGTWTELLPPGFETGFGFGPWTLFTDRDNRFWYNGHPVDGSSGIGVFMYDPMLVNANEVASSGRQMRVFPNPASDVIYLQISGWENQQVQIAVRNAQGSLLLQQARATMDDFVVLELPTHWPAGVYYLEAISEKGERQTGRFVRVTKK